MDNTYKIITFQHKSVLETLLNSGKYKCLRKSKYYEATPNCYDRLLENIPTKIEGVNIPIFGWYAVIEEDNNLLTVDDKTINRALEMTGQNCNDYYLFEMEIPKEYVSLQDFYNFVDVRCQEEDELDGFVGDPWDYVFIVEPNREIQATFPIIKKEWIKNVYEYYEEKVNKFRSNKKVGNLIFQNKKKV